MKYHNSKEELISQLRKTRKYVSGTFTSVDHELAVLDAIYLLEMMPKHHARKIEELKAKHAEELTEARMREVRLAGT